MTHARRTRRVAAALLLTVIGAGALAVPVSAGTATTRYVDDDGLAGPAGCGGTNTVPTSIQAAVDASVAGDTVLVCPGGYPETVDVDTAQLTIRGVTPWKAVVRPASTSIGAAIRLGAGADGSRLQWLKVLGRTTGSCSLIEDGIQVNGADDVTIISNRVVASSKGDAFYGSCGIRTGIHVATGGSALVRYNLVRDFRLQGIWLQSADAGTAVKNNSVRFLHPDGCLATTACVSGTSPAIGDAPIGIHVHNTSAIVTNNAVSSGAFHVAFGIRLNASSGLRVVGNRVRNTESFGMDVRDVTDSTIDRNDLADGYGNGLVLEGVSTGNRIRQNQVRGHYGNGIRLLAAATGNSLVRNDARGNVGIDCQDDPEASTWTGNLGDESSPVGICSVP